MNSVTAEQISRSPDGDAAQAVKRVSGVTVQDGKYVFVRGLGERYTTSSLNGARVPSPEPEKRVVPLDMFPAGLLQTITTSKTFTPDLQGDFSGALVDIKTREFPARAAVLSRSASGYAAGATGQNVLLGVDVGGGMRFANVGSSRDLPAIFRRVGNMQTIQLNQGDKNLLVSSFRNAWTPARGSGTPLLNGSASIGGNDPVFGHRIGYLFSGSYSSGTDMKDAQVRALADRGDAMGSTVEIDRFVGTTTSQSVLWGGLTNLSTLIGESSAPVVQRHVQPLGRQRRARRGRRVQLGRDAGADHAHAVHAARHLLGAARGRAPGRRGAAARVERHGERRAPLRAGPARRSCRSSRRHAAGQDVLRWQGGGSGGAVRTFSDLKENSHEYQAKYPIDFGAAGAPTTVKFGGLYRATGRDAQSLSYNISSVRLTDAQRELPLEQIFDGQFTQQGQAVFDIGPALAGRIVRRAGPSERRLPDGRGTARRAAQDHRRRALRERPARRRRRVDARDAGLDVQALERLAAVARR